MNETEKQLDLLGLFHFILGGLTALFACLPLIHVGVGAALLLGAFDSGPAAPGSSAGFSFSWAACSCSAAGRSPPP